jgi:hypothetical protein
MRFIHLVSLCFRVYVSNTLGPFLLAFYVICFYYYDLLCLLSRFWPIISALSASHITIFNLTFFSISNEVACLYLLLCLTQTSSSSGWSSIPFTSRVSPRLIAPVPCWEEATILPSPTASERAEGPPWMTQAGLQ